MAVQVVQVVQAAAVLAVIQETPLEQQERLILVAAVVQVVKLLRQQPLPQAVKAVQE
jgi:hypothetical protein